MRILKKILAEVMVVVLACGLVEPVLAGETKAIAAETTTAVNILNYESNTTADEYAVYDVEGMEYLATLVNDKGITFEGKTISLESDLKYDKSVENNHTPIGTLDNPFSGNFNGNSHVIEGLNIYMKKDNNNTVQLGLCLGLFGYVESLYTGCTISSVAIDDSIFIDEPNDSVGVHYIAAVLGCAESRSTQKIYVENCMVSSSVQIFENERVADAGGVVGDIYNGEIIGCKNEADIYSDGSAGGITSKIWKSLCKNSINWGDITGKEDAGGLIGLSTVDSKVVESCNHGKVEDGNKESTGEIYGTGGLVGSQEEGNLINCYNAGDVVINQAGKLAGGIAGTTYYDNLFNLYTKGEVTNKKGYAGAVYSAFYNNADLTMKYIYWEKGSAACNVNTEYLKTDVSDYLVDVSSVYEYTETQMKSKSFVEELNKNSTAEGYGEVWAADTKNINDGYPILKNVPYDTDFKAGTTEDTTENTTEETGEVGESKRIYHDYTYTNSVSGTAIRIYVNGTKVKEDETTTNYKSCTLFTDITPSYIHTVGKNGAVTSKSGKVVVGITSSSSKPTLEKDKIVDKEAAKIAKATIKNGQITVTAGKKSGVVYLWVIDTGSVGAYDSYPINVKGAPAIINLYSEDTSSSNFSFSSATKYTKDNLKVGNTVKVYLYPYMKADGSVVKTSSGTYTATVDSKANDYISVKQDTTNPFCYIITAKSLKNGKKVAGKVTFQCKQSGKKVAFTANVVPN